MTAAPLALRLTVSALAVACLAGLVHIVSMLGIHVPFDPNEGWNAYFAQMAMRSGSPYPADGGFMVNNYPPLSFYLIGTFGKLLGDDIFAGRIVSLLALLATACGIGAAARRMGCRTWHAAFAGLLFIACVLLTSDYAGMNDPQLLSHAIAMGGLVAVLRIPRTPRNLVFAPLLFTLAFFFKHNLVLLPLAVALWLLLVDRRHAVTFIASGGIFLLIGLGIFREVFGIGFFHQIASARLYSLDNLMAGAATWLAFAAVPLCGALVLLRIARRDQYAVLAIIYAGVAVIGGFAFLGGAGVDANALFDADIALALCAGLLLDRLEDERWSAAAAIIYIIPLVLLLRSVDGDWGSTDFWLHPLREESAVARSEIAALRVAREPVLCDMLALCYWAGKAPQVDVFNTDQRLRAGALDARSFIQRINTRDYSIIELETLHPFPLPPDVERAVRRNYEIIRTDDERVFLAPR